MKKLYFFILFTIYCFHSFSQQTQKPPIHGKKWMAITGKPLAATAGSMIFQQGGNAVDAACAMLAATCTMWDVLSWGGETQALIYNPKTKKVIGINALGVAPKLATVDFYKRKGYQFPPEFGPLAAITPGTFGGLCHMLSEYGTMSLNQVLYPAIQLASGYPIDAQTANSIERAKEKIKEWPYSKKVFLTHPGEKREAPEPGELFIQKDLLNTLLKLVETEKEEFKKHKDRKKAIMAANNRFYCGDIADEFVRGAKEQGGIISKKDLIDWKVKEEDPLHVNYKGVEVYKLSQWTQGPSLLQALNILENFDIKKMGYNSPEYINTLYQTMSLSFADRDFYYGDPVFAAEKQPMTGLLSKSYAKERAKLINPLKNIVFVSPGDPYPFEGRINPYLNSINQKINKADSTSNRFFIPTHDNQSLSMSERENYNDRMWRGTTSVEAADAEGWVVSITPSGGWIPACIAGNTGIGMSQRMQSFVLDSAINPFNVLQPGKQPRVTLTPSLALQNGSPYLSFAVQGGDTQDQNLLQFFLNVYDFGMTVQQATEAPNINTNQLWLSLGGSKITDRQPRPGEILISSKTSEKTKEKLKEMGYIITTGERTSGPINAIYFDKKHQTIWGGSSNNGEDYGIGW